MGADPSSGVGFYASRVSVVRGKFLMLVLVVLSLDKCFEFKGGNDTNNRRD